MVDTKDFSTILSGLLNDFPAIGAREIRFGELGDKSGVGIYPSAAATVISETTDIMGSVYQKCNYAFQVAYRAVPQSETDRIHIKGWLDKLGGGWKNNRSRRTASSTRLPRGQTSAMAGRSLHLYRCRRPIWPGAMPTVWKTGPCPCRCGTTTILKGDALCLKVRLLTPLRVRRSPANC